MQECPHRYFNDGLRNSLSLGICRGARRAKQVCCQAKSPEKEATVAYTKKHSGIRYYLKSRDGNNVPCTHLGGCTAAFALEELSSS